MAELGDLRFRRATVADWAAANPVLGQGEPAAAFTSSGELALLKVGDGTTPWNDLEGFSPFDFTLGIDADTLDGLDSTAFDPAGAGLAAVATHEAKTDPHPQYVTSAELANNDAAVAAHAAQTTNVHGITNTADLATTAYVTTQINDLIAGAPGALDTLNELATALGNDPNFATTVANNINLRVEKATYDANTILAAHVDNTPVAIPVDTGTIVGRASGSQIAALTPGQVRAIINVEDGATNDQTAEEILAKLLTVDGTGSGLDADLLDGLNSTAFAAAAHTHVSTDITDFVEAAQDAVAAATGAGTHVGVAVNYNDAANTLSFVLGFDSTAPTAMGAGLGGSAGSTTVPARRDHRHALTAAAPSTTLTSNTANAEGTATTVARSDHTHAITFFDATAPATLTPNIAAATGGASVAARRDHVHNVPVGTAVALSNLSTNGAGVAATFARSDHTHQITGFLGKFEKAADSDLLDGLDSTAFSLDGHIHGEYGSDGSPPATSPTPFITGGPGYLLIEWLPVANADLVIYEVHLGTSAGFTPGAGTKLGETAATGYVTARADAANNDLVYGANYYAKIIAKDDDGAAAASAASAAGQMLKIDTVDLGDEVVTAAKILAGTITATQIAANTITAAKIAAGTITATEIAGSTITGAKIAADTLTAAHIAANAITASELAADSVTTDKILARTITAGDIATGTITANEIAANTITATQIAANTITAAQIAADTITAAQIAAGAIETSELAAGAVTAAKIAANTITAGQIAAGTITATELGANSVTTIKLDAQAVTAAKIAANTITAAQIAAGTITSAQIAADTITAGNIAAGAIETSELAAGAVTAAKIAANTITAGQIAAGTITATEIAAGTITATQIASGTITGDRLVANTITAGQIAANTITATEIAATTITANELASNAVTTIKLNANAVTAAKIAADTITARELAIGSFDNLIPDPGFEQTTGSPHVLSTGATIVTANMRSGARALQIASGTAADVWYPHAVSTPGAHPTVSEGDSIYFECYARRSVSGTAAIFDMGLKWRTSAGAAISETTVACSPAGALYEKFSITATAPANAAYVVPFLKRRASTGTAVVDDLYARRMLTGSLIVDGSITAANIAANTITSTQIAAGTITATELAAINLTVGKHIQSAGFTPGPGGTGWRLDGDGNLEAHSGTFRGAVVGATITGSLFRTAATGGRIEIDASDPDRITFHSADPDADPNYPGRIVISGTEITMVAPQLVTDGGWGVGGFSLGGGNQPYMNVRGDLIARWTPDGAGYTDRVTVKAHGDGHPVLGGAPAAQIAVSSHYPGNAFVPTPFTYQWSLRQETALNSSELLWRVMAEWNQNSDQFGSPQPGGSQVEVARFHPTQGFRSNRIEATNALLLNGSAVARADRLTTRHVTVQLGATPAGTTSATYVNFSPTVSLTIPKAGGAAETSILVTWHGATYNDNGLGQYEVGVLTGSNTQGLAAGFGTAGSGSGQTMFSGLAAGNHTFTLRRRRVNATGTVFDGQPYAYNHLVLQEVYI